MKKQVKLHFYNLLDYCSFLYSEAVHENEIFVLERENEVFNNYKIIDSMKEVNSGCVDKVLHKASNSIRSMKTIINESQDTFQIYLFNEISIHKRLDHPNILKMYEFLVASFNYYIIVEYCTFGNLYQMLKRHHHFSELQAAYIIFQLLLAIRYCHSLNIAHCDLRLENIQLKSIRNKSYYNIKLSNFESAKLIEKNAFLQTPVGSLFYIAPEILKTCYNEKCDIWSIGIILYVLLTGTSPIQVNNNEIYQKILIYNFNKEDPNLKAFNISEEAKNFLSKLIEQRIEIRYTAEQALNDEWFKKLQIKEKLYPNSKTRFKEKIENIIIKTKNNEFKKLQRIAIALLTNNIPITGEI